MEIRKLNGKEDVINVLMECAVVCGRVSSFFHCRSGNTAFMCSKSVQCARVCLETMKQLREGKEINFKRVLAEIRELRTCLSGSNYGLGNYRQSLTNFESKIHRISGLIC